MFRELFKSRNKYVTVHRDIHHTDQTISSDKKDLATKEDPDHLWTKCQSCSEIIFNKKLSENQMICPVCDYHFRITASERLKFLLDEGTFSELFQEVISTNPLNFAGYTEKLEKTRKKTDLNEAVITGRGKIKDMQLAIGVMDFTFAGGSLGSAVGEKITSLIEFATAQQLPLVLISTAGGARMQEGMLSLMQMAKTSAALGRFLKAGLLYVSVLADPTSGGVTASYAMLGDIILAEPGALIAFAGPRVIKQTIQQELPEGFQRSEFLLEHGMIDRVVHRHHLRDELSRIFSIHRLVGEAQ